MTMEHVAAHAKISPPVLVRGCMEGFQWHWEVPTSISVEDLVLGLRESGFRDESQFDWVWELINQDEHKIVIVPKTRRLQIRINYMVPKPKREITAWKIAVILHEVCMRTQYA